MSKTLFLAAITTTSVANAHPMAKEPLVDFFHRLTSFHHWPAVGLLFLVLATSFYFLKPKKNKAKETI